MTTELEQKIMDLINGAETAIPEVAQEYLAWGLYSNYMFICIGLVFIVIGIVMFIYMDKIDVEILACATIAIPLLLLLFIALPVYEIVQIKTAPKVYLIDSLMGNK